MLEDPAGTSRKPARVRYAAVRFDVGDDRAMEPLPASHLRIARLSRDLRASERFWVDGLGLEVLFRADASAEGGHALLTVGWPDATWHLELVKDAPRPGNVTNYVNPRQVWWRSASIGVPHPPHPRDFGKPSCRWQPGLRRIRQRTEQGKIPWEIRRCLNRYIARELYRQLNQSMKSPPAPDEHMSVRC